MTAPIAPPWTASPWQKRLLPLASIGYVAALALWAARGSDPRAWLTGLGALGVGFAAARREERIVRAVGWGMAVVLASLGGRGAGVEACGSVGAMVCSMGAAGALARIPAAGGVVRTAPSSSRPVVLALALVWGTAVLARLTPDRGGLSSLAEHARLWAAGAAIGATALLLLASEWTLRRRRLDLGVVERAMAIRALLGTGATVALVVALVDRAQADALGRVVVAASSAMIAAAALARDPVRVARITRRVVALVIVGGGVTLLGAATAAGRGADAWTVTVVTAVLTSTIGAAVTLFEGPLRPARGVWLDAFANACSQSSQGNPEDSIREVLLALRAPGGPAGSSPELWTLSPTRLATVDAAGYMQQREAELPATLLLLAAGEPDATLRAEVLDSLEVRRPELRAVAKWMTNRRALLATVVACEGEPEGVLVLPRFTRDEPVTLEEVRALKEVADRLAAACRAHATQQRMLARAQEAMQRAEAAEETIERLRYEQAVDVGRHALATTRLARPATVGVYSDASRAALEALERRTSIGAPIVVVAPTGVDPVPYLARAHLAGARREAALVLVDSTSAREHDVARWSDPYASPLALANRGMLVLLDGAALPSEVQQLVARSLAEKRTPWERPVALDVQLAFTATLPADALVAAGRLDAALALRLGEASNPGVVLPRLRDRPEDLRSILTDRLAREGMRVLGRPIGIDHAAYARIVEHTFPGEDAELSAMVQRLVARCAGDVVRACDVDALRIAIEATGADGRHRIPGAGRKDPLSA